MSKWLLFIVMTGLALGASAQQQFVEGKDYDVLEDPVRTSDPSRVEVTEVFWYGCPHCNNFRPIFAEWKSRQADDVDIQHSPAMWNGRMVTHAKIYYTAKALGVAEAMHKDVFDAMHLRKKRMLSEGEIYTLFKKHNVTKEDFEKTFDSFGVRSLVQQAESRARGYGITGTPEVVVNGKYRLTTRKAGSHQRLLQIIDFLVAKERVAMATQS